MTWRSGVPSARGKGRWGGAAGSGVRRAWAITQRVALKLDRIVG